MLGEGMPWMFLLPIAIIGFLWGISSGKREEAIQKLKNKV